MVSRFNNNIQVIHAYPFPNISGITKKEYNSDGGNEDMELPIFDFMAIANATCNFSSNNKLGEGGFGPVYKVNKTSKPVNLSSLTNLPYLLIFRVHCKRGKW